MRQRQSESNSIHDVITTWIPAIALFVSVFFLTPGFDAFNFSKQAVLLAGVGAMGVFYFLNLRKLSPNKIDIFLLISILAVIFITLFLHGLEHRYWWGVFARANGNLTNIAFLMLTVMVASYFSSKLLHRIFISALIALILQCAYGVIQFLNLDPVNWENPHSPVITFFGNPNFAAASFGFLSVAILRFVNFDTQNVGSFISKNFFQILLFVLSLFLNYQTKSIQGVATVAVGIYILVGLRYVFNSGKLKFKNFVKILYAVIPLIIGLGFGGLGPLGALLRQETFLNRIEYWRIASKIILDYPWLGVGPDGYSQFYQQYRSLEYTERYGVGLSSSAAHNVLLQWGSSYGLIGIIIYGSLLLICIKRFFVINKKIQSSDKSLFQITFTLWATYQATALVSIEQIGVAVWGWIFTGVILGWSSKIVNENDFKKAQFSSKNNSKVISTGLDGPVFLLVVLLSFPASHHIRQDLALRSAVQLPGASAGVQGSDLDTRGNTIYQAAYPLRNDKDYFQFAIMSLYLGGPASIGQKLATETLVGDPRNTQALEALAVASNNLKNWEEEITYRRLLVELDPHNYVNEAKIGLALYNLGRKQEALQVLESANSKSSRDPALDSFKGLQLLIQEEMD